MATINRRSTRHASEAQQRQERGSGRGGAAAAAAAAKRGQSEIATTAPTASNSNSIATTTSTRSSYPNIPQQTHPARMKRPLEIIDTNLDHPKSKRARIAVEIISRSIPPGISPPKSIAVRPQSTTQSAAKPATVATTQRKLHQQRQQQTPPPPDSESPPPFAAAADQSASHSQTPATDDDSNSSQQSPLPSLTRHQEKVKNGIKHELDRLQPNPTDATTQTPKEQGGRKLRSQEQTRFKSELSAYFPDYDEVIGNDPKEQRT